MKISILTATGNYNLGDELILESELKLITSIFTNFNSKKNKSKKILDIDFSYLLEKEKEKNNILYINIFGYDQKSLLNNNIIKLVSDSKQALSLDLNLNQNNINENNYNSKKIALNFNYIKYFPYNFKRHIYKNIKYLIKNIYEIATSDLIIIGGGGLLYDNEVQSNSNPLSQWYLRVLIAKIFKTKIVFLGIGINIKNIINYNILKKILNKSDKIYVRDIKSKNLLLKLNIKSKIIPDTVWYLNKKDISKLEDNKSNNNLIKKNKYIGISIRQGYLKNEKENLIKIINLIKKYGYNIIFLNTSFHKDDILANDMLFIQKYFPNEIYTKTQKETLYYLNSVDYIIGMRFHSIILSLIFKKRCLVVSYQNKTKLLAKNLDLDYINTLDFEFNNFKNKFKELIKKKKINKNTKKKIKENKYSIKNLK